MSKLWTPRVGDNLAFIDRYLGPLLLGLGVFMELLGCLSFTKFATSKSDVCSTLSSLSSVCASLAPSFCWVSPCTPPRRRPASASASKGLKSSQQQKAKTSLRDEEEMGKSPFTRVVLPIIDKMSKFFGQMTPVTSLNRARISIIQAGLQGKVFPAQITTMSYILMVLIPFMSLSSRAYRLRSCVGNRPCYSSVFSSDTGCPSVISGQSAGAAA